MRAPSWTDEELWLATDLLAKNDWSPIDRNDSECHALSTFLRQFPAHTGELPDNYRSTSSIARKTQNIFDKLPWNSGTKQSHGNKREHLVLSQYLNDQAVSHTKALAIRELMELRQFSYEPIESVADNASVLEGARVEKLCRGYSRATQIRKLKVQELSANGRDLSCEVCGFSFREVYGDRGEGYIEIHHIVALSESGDTVTSKSDLIGLCANCHRIMHRKKPWLTPNQLKELVEQSRS